jgi:hypothetical protein
LSVETSTVTELKSELSVLRGAMAQGVRQVDYESYSVSYSTFAEMRRREKWLIDRIEALQGTKRKRVRRLNTRKGL